MRTRAPTARRGALAALSLVTALAMPAAFAQPAPRPPGPPVAGARAPAARPRPGKPVKLDLAAATAALQGGDLAAARKAAEALAVADPAAHGALLDALVTGLHPEVAIVALDGLDKARTEADVPTILAYARHRNPAVRAAAIRALTNQPSPPAAARSLAALRDNDATVRAAAAVSAGVRRDRAAVPPLLALLDKGETPAALALGALADADLARVVAEHLGAAPDPTLAKSLGAMLVRKDFGPEPARLEVVRTLAKMDGTQVIAALSDYVDATPATPVVQSRREAEAALKLKLEDK